MTPERRLTLACYTVAAATETLAECPPAHRRRALEHVQRAKVAIELLMLHDLAETVTDERIISAVGNLHRECRAIAGLVSGHEKKRLWPRMFLR